MGYNVGIVGATGAVGQEMIGLLEELRFPVDQLKLFGSSRSAGRELPALGRRIAVEEAAAGAFGGLDVVLFSAGASVSRELCPAAVKAGAVAIDNSSAFRMDPEVPLVIPEINPEAARRHKGIVANPNCSTAIALMGLHPLHKAFGLKRVFAATYQAVSGSGAGGLRELEAQARAWAEGREAETQVYPHPIAFNVIPHVDAFQENGYTKEEMKLVNECRKILDIPELLVSCTCVRVPVWRSHSVAISAEFERPVSVEEARETIAFAKGVDLIDDPESDSYPMPLHLAGEINCAVGRLRKDLALENGLAFWVSGDQLWKGAALNAIQIAETLFSENRRSRRKG